MPIARYHENLKKAITTAIRAAWPEIHGNDHPIYWNEQVERFPWREMVQAGELSEPWVILKQTPERQDMAYSNVVYRSRFSIGYVTPLRRDTHDFLRDKIHALENMVVYEPFTSAAGDPDAEVYCQQMWNFETDLSETNFINLIFTKQNMPYQGGVFSFDAIFGYTNAAEAMAGN